MKRTVQTPAQFHLPAAVPLPEPAAPAGASGKRDGGKRRGCPVPASGDADHHARRGPFSSPACQRVPALHQRAGAAKRHPTAPSQDKMYAHGAGKSWLLPEKRPCSTAELLLSMERGRPDPEGRGYPGEALHLAGRHLQHPYGYRADHPRPVSHPAGGQQPVPEPEDPVPEDLIRKENPMPKPLFTRLAAICAVGLFCVPVWRRLCPVSEGIPSCWS